MEHLSMEIMNTSFYVAVSNCEKSWKDEIRNWLLYVDQQWSRFQENNELHQLNEAKTGEWINVSPTFFDVIQKADLFRKQTNNLFNPMMLRQIQAHGYERSFPFNHRPEQSSIPALDHHVEPLLFDPVNLAIYKQEDVKVDLGGIGKGYAVESAARWLQTIGRCSSGIVDGGGDIKVWSHDGKIWSIGIADPYNKEEEIANIRLKNGAIATSNRVFRKWKQGEEEKHHILNGQTGRIAETNIIQATCVATNCLVAEVGAKVSFLVKAHERKSFLRNVDPLNKYLLVTDKSKMIKIEGRNEVASLG